MPRATSFDLQRPVTLSMFAVWLAIGAAILVVAVLWALAFNSGYKRGEHDTIRDLGQGGGGAVTEPLHKDIPVNPTLVSPTPQTPPRQAAQVAPPGPATPPATGGDPRVVGLNYLVIGYKVDKEFAERAGAFLAQNGVQTFAVAKPGTSANNPGSYTLYALPGITRDEYRAQAPAKTDLQERIARLGKIWQKDHKGQTDFSRTTWEKFGS
jgi:hypothetical protein